MSAPSNALSSGELLASHSAVPKPFHLYGGEYSFKGLADSHLILLPSLHGGEGSSFPGCLPPNDMVNSELVVRIKPGVSGMMIGCQVDEFTCIWSVECFITQSNIYPSFTDKVSTLTHFTLDPDCEDYPFLDQAVKDFEYDLDFILTDSVDTQELEVPFNEADAMPTSGFLCLVNTYADHARLQLAPSIRCHKLWCQSKALLLPVPQMGKMSAS